MLVIINKAIMTPLVRAGVVRPDECFLAWAHRGDRERSGPSFVHSMIDPNQVGGSFLRFRSQRAIQTSGKHNASCLSKHM